MPIVPALLALLGAALSDEQRTKTLRDYPQITQLALEAPNWPDLHFIPGASFNPEAPFRLGNVYFSSEAPGAVAHSRNVNYMGFVIWMTPGDFLRLNPRRGRPHNYILAARAEGWPLGPLMLYMAIHPDNHWDTLDERKDAVERGEPIEPLEWLVTGHEGRGRAITQNLIDPDRLVPVLTLPRYLRARHFTPEMLLGGFILGDRRGNQGGHFIRRITLDRVNHGWAP